MNFRKTELQGVYIVELQKLEESRGFFARAWCKHELEAAGLEAEIVQCNISYNAKKGTLRGLHYQADPYAEIKFVRCIRGAIFDVAVDLRENSTTYLKWMGVELSDINRNALYIPEGFAHGYQTLVDESEVFYQVSAYYNATYERGLRWDDQTIGIQWPDSNSVILSTKDRTWPDYVFKKSLQLQSSPVGK